MTPAQMVALDVDGTIIDFDENLSEAVRRRIHDLVDAGVHVVVATGRSLVGTLPILDRLSLLEGYAVCSNGAVTVRLDPALEGGYEVVDAVTFDPAPALRLLREHLPTAVYAVEDTGSGFRLSAPFPDDELPGELRIVPFESLLEGPATRVVVRSPEHTSQDFLAVTERIGLHGVNYAVGWTAWLDLAPEGVSKASALEQVRERLGVLPSATVAVGDGRNDVEMFRWAARAVAMGGAADEALAAADEVTGDVKDDGLVPVLESVLASHQGYVSHEAGG